MTAFGWWSRVAALVVKTWINITTGQTYVFFFFVETWPLLCREVTIIVEVQLETQNMSINFSP